MIRKPLNFLLAGVGGQGTLLASDIVAEVGLRLGLDAKKSEVHGMSQRGGAVVSHVRWGEQVASPLAEKGTIDYFVAQEMLESLRWLSYLRPGGTIVLSREERPPTGTVFGNAVYPKEEKVISTVSQLAGRVLLLDAAGVAEELGNRRAANSVLLGALSAVLSPDIEVDEDAWLDVIVSKVPSRHIEVNRRAYKAGREGQWELASDVVTGGS